MKDRQPHEGSREIDRPFQELLTELLDPSRPVRAALIYRLSNPSDNEFELLRSQWLHIPIDRRRTLLGRIADISVDAFDLDFGRVARLALQDEDEEVRQKAIVALWVDDRPSLSDVLIRVACDDASESVRVQAAQALGRFVLAGELDEIEPSKVTRVKAALFEIINKADSTSELYRRALESLSYADNERVDDLILAASNSEDIEMRATAIFSMGRSSNQRWAPYVLKALAESDESLRYEAARAAGELTLGSALPTLLRLTRDNDREIKEAAIWSLGEIGGEVAKRRLFELAEETANDKALLETIEDALNMAVLMEGNLSSYLLEHDDEDDLLLDEPGI